MQIFLRNPSLFLSKTPVLPSLTLSQQYRNYASYTYMTEEGYRRILPNYGIKRGRKNRTKYNKGKKYFLDRKKVLKRMYEGKSEGQIAMMEARIQKTKGIQWEPITPIEVEYKKHMTQLMFEKRIPMIKWGHKHAPYYINNLLKQCETEEDFGYVLKIWRQYMFHQVRFNAETTRLLVEGFITKLEDLETAVNIMCNLFNWNRQEADLKTCFWVIEKALENDDVESAIRVYKAMTAPKWWERIPGINPRKYDHFRFMEMLFARDKKSEAMTAYKEMPKNKDPLELGGGYKRHVSPTYYKLLDACAEAGDVEMAKMMYNDLLASGYKETDDLVVKVKELIPPESEAQEEEAAEEEENNEEDE